MQSGDLCPSWPRPCFPPHLCFPVPEVPASALLGLESSSTYHPAQGRDWEGQGGREGAQGGREGASLAGRAGGSQSPLPCQSWPLSSVSLSPIVICRMGASAGSLGEGR